MGDAGLRGKMWAVYVLLISFWHLSTSQDCQVIVSQIKPIQRPEGRAVFTCEMPGVSYQQLSAYQWFTEDSDTPLFTNLISFNKITLSEKYAYMNINEKRNTSGPFLSKLQVQLNIAQTHVFKCEAHMSDGIFCANSIKTQFLDPRIAISPSSTTVPRMSPGETTHVSVICKVDIAAGVPTLDISYRPANEDGFPADKQISLVTHHNLYYSGKQRGDLFVKEGGEIVCTVNDKLGTYRATHNIAIKGCPDSVKLRIRQHTPAQRPTDRVELTCTLTGVSLQELLYYRWLIQETDDILYTYSDIFNTANTTVRNTAMSPNETRETSARWIQSQLELQINLSFSQIIRFEMKTNNKDLCFATSRIAVADPKVTLTVNDSGVSFTAREDEVLLVSCSIDAARGKPRLELVANVGELGVVNNNTNTTFKNCDFYYHGLIEETTTVSRSGRIICFVRDELGTYTDTMEIKVIHTEDRGRGDTSIITGILFGISTFSILLLLLILLVRKLRRKDNRESHGCNIEMNAEPETNRLLVQTTSDTKIHNLSQDRELSSVRKPGLALDLVWAYNSFESSKQCENLRRCLMGLDLNVEKKNRSQQNPNNLSNTSRECFVVMLWDGAAMRDATFKEVALQVNTLDIKQENIMGLHVIMEENANMTPIKDNEDFRYLLWFKEPEPRGMDELAKKIKNIMQKQMSSLKGVNFIVEGLVWSYVAVYLKTVLGYLKDQGGIKQIRAGSNDGKDIYDKFLIIIPKSCRCIPISRGCDKGCYRTEGKLCEIRLDDAGMKGRRFDPAIHVVKANQTSEEVSFIGEFANPVNTLHQLKDEGTVVDNETLVNNFEQRLCFILDHRIHGFRKLYEIVRFDDESPGSPSLNNVLISHMTRSSTIQLIDSKSDTIYIHHLYVLGDCDDTDNCTIDQPKCGVHHILAAMKDTIDINATEVTTSEFSQGVTKRRFNNAQRRNDVLCFVWNKRYLKKQILLRCLEHAKQNSDVYKRIIHVETESDSMPEENNSISFRFEQTDKNHDRQRFQSKLKDLLLKGEDTNLCGLVGIGLAISFYYSYMTHKMDGWDERLDEKKHHFETLHDKLVIIIPQTGRTLDTIPGCHIIQHDTAKLQKYNAAQGDTAKLGEDYKKLPALWVKNKTAGRNYMTTIYKVGGDKQNCAAIEYATPVRTLYVMYNAGHDTKSHTIGQLTEAWLMAEIDMLYKELKRLIKQAKPAIRDNVDLVYVEDGELSELSEEDYRKQVTKRMRLELQKLFRENKTS